MNREKDPSLARFMSDEDVRLMLAFKAGDMRAFGQLVEKYTEPLVNYFFFQCHDRDLAEDCTQELWAKIFRSHAEYEPRATFSTFVYRVARNLWIDVYRTVQRRPTVSSLSGEDAESDRSSLGERLEGEEAPPEDVLAQRELVEVLARALASLPPEMAEVYVLGEVEQLPYADISEILEIPIGTVKSRMFNAVRRLRELLGRRLEDSPRKP